MAEWSKAFVLKAGKRCFMSSNLIAPSMNWDFWFIVPEICLLLFILYSLISFFNSMSLEVSRWAFNLIVLLIFLFGIWSYLKYILIFKELDNILNSLEVIFFVNEYSIFCKIFLSYLTLIILYISKNKIYCLERGLVCLGEFPIILGFSLFFIFVLISSFDFFGLYLALEGLSLTLYVLSSLLRDGFLPIEAAIKYFSLGALSTGFLLYGMAIIFSIIGSLDFLEIYLFLGSENLLFVISELKIGFTFIIVGFLFKIGAFPFHIWVVDVYEGVWTPITAFFSIVIKSSILFLFFRIIFYVMFSIMHLFQFLFILVSLGSMVFGIIGCSRQYKIKRFLAYMSITQVGFIFLGISSCNLLGLLASFIYLILYTFMNLIFFCILLNVEHIVTRRNLIYLTDFYSFSAYNRSITKYLILVIFSMSGLPPLGGFFGKLLLYLAAMNADLDFVICFSLIIGVVSSYYYLSFIRHICCEKSKIPKLYFFKDIYELEFFSYFSNWSFGLYEFMFYKKEFSFLLSYVFKSDSKNLILVFSLFLNSLYFFDLISFTSNCYLWSIIRSCVFPLYSILLW